MHACMYVYLFMHVYSTFICMYLCVFVCTVCMYVRMHVSTCIFNNLRIEVWTSRLSLSLCNNTVDWKMFGSSQSVPNYRRSFKNWIGTASFRRGLASFSCGSRRRFRMSYIALLFFLLRLGRLRRIVGRCKQFRERVLSLGHVRMANERRSEAESS